MFDGLRKYYKLNTILIASFTKNSIDTITSISCNRRLFNLTIIERITILYKALSLNTEFKDLPHALNFIANEPVDISLFQSTIEKKERLLENAELRRSKMIEKREEIIRGMHACISLQEDFSFDSENQKWLQIVKDRLRYKLSPNSKTKLLQLEHNIATLKFQIIDLKQRIAEIETQE